MSQENETLEFSNHISKNFDAELESIRTEFLTMGGLVEKQITDAMKALLDADEVLAQQVIENDDKVNEFECSLDERIAKLLVRRQPAARDLRLVLMISKSITDLERIGDEAAKIAKIARMMIQEGLTPKGYRETRSLGEQVSLMLGKMLDSFARFDAEQALDVMKTDEYVDEEYQMAMRALLTYMLEDSRYIHRVINVKWVLRALERIGDHVSNVAEQIIYVVSGSDVRHMSIKELEKALRDNGNIA